MRHQNLGSKDFWEKNWSLETRSADNKFVFDDLVEKYVPKGGTYFEVGCAPGSFMGYFFHNMNCNVSGIDFCERGAIEQYLKSNNVTNFTIFENDFTTWNSLNKYDIVGSYGFIEHFGDTEEIIKRHVELVENQGYLILAVPNLRYLNWLIYRILSPKTLSIHNLRIMNPTLMAKQVLAAGSFEILFKGYYGTSFFQFNSDNPELNKIPLLKKVFKLIASTMSFFKIKNISTKFFSPYIILIAKKTVK